MAPQGTLKYTLGPEAQDVLGQGAYGIVYRATEEGSGRSVAVKKSRVSIRTKRPALRHEVRILQLLKGQSAIPIVYGYGHLRHFEYIAMELLGPSISERQKDGAAVMPTTVVCIVDQALAALQHIHSLGIVHRDIKPDNFLCALDDPSTIKLIDFGISKPFSSHTCGRTTYNPLQDRRHIVGSLYWASLNAHNGKDLGPRDDIESLALIVLFLLRGNLPWKPRPHHESQLRSQEVVRILKSACSGPSLSADFPTEFGELLTYGRSLSHDHRPDHENCRALFRELSKRTGHSLDGPLDWTPCDPHTAGPFLEEPTVLIPNEDEDEDDGSDDGLGGDSNSIPTLGPWFRQGERDKDVTLPAEQAAELDMTISRIEQVGANV